MSFHNTINLQGHSLAQAIGRAQTQETKILHFFEFHQQLAFAPHEIKRCLDAYFNNTPLTSIRRAITNLERSGALVKTDQMINGPYGKPVHRWRLAKTAKPVQPALF